MLKLIDYLLYKVVEFFNRKHIGFVWIIAFLVSDAIAYYYEVSNGYEVKSYWYDHVKVVFLLATYLRAKWIINKLEEPK